MVIAPLSECRKSSLIKREGLTNRRKTAKNLVNSLKNR